MNNESNYYSNQREGQSQNLFIYGAHINSKVDL